MVFITLLKDLENEYIKRKNIPQWYNRKQQEQPRPTEGHWAD